MLLLLACATVSCRKKVVEERPFSEKTDAGDGEVFHYTGSCNVERGIALCTLDIRCSDSTYRYVIEEQSLQSGGVQEGYVFKRTSADTTFIDLKSSNSANVATYIQEEASDSLVFYQSSQELPWPAFLVKISE